MKTVKSAQSKVQGPRCADRVRRPHDIPRSAFTLIEILISIGILALVITAIYSSWTAILRSAKVGQRVAATVQRSRIVVRVLEDSLASAMCYVANQQYYGFVAQNGREASLSFVARLSKSFPRSGKFGDLDVRRVTFSLESGPDSSQQLVLRQCPLVMDLDIDEKEHPVVLAKNVKDFELRFWDPQQQDWTDEWTQTNQLPRGVLVTLRLADTARSTSAQIEISRIISIPSVAVLPVWQMPRVMPGTPGGPGMPGQPGAVPGTTTPGGTTGTTPSAPSPIR